MCVSDSPVCLIKHHILHILELQVHLHDNVHQTTRGSDDSAERGGGELSHRDVLLVLANVVQPQACAAQTGEAGDLTCLGFHEGQQTGRPSGLLPGSEPSSAL